MSPRFRNREQAGRILADKLEHYAELPGTIILALPRGGVPVAYQVARQLQAPLDVFLVRKLGVPGHEELAMGAIASGDICYLNEPLINSLGIESEIVNAVIHQAKKELRQREVAYRTGPPLDLRGAAIILVDDGLATGASMRAAVMACRERHPARIVVAAPVAAPDTCREMRLEVDEVVCVRTPPEFEGVGQWYDDFAQTTDEEVRLLLQRAKVEWGERRQGALAGGV